jgi:hypothetical protein
VIARVQRGNRMKSVKKQIVLFPLLCLALIANASAANYAVGVKAGDYVKYDLTIYAALIVRESTKITITSISGTQITGSVEISTTGVPAPVPPTNQTFTLDVSTGASTGYTSISVFIIPANLSVGQVIPGQDAIVQRIGDWDGRKAVYPNYTSPSLPEFPRPQTCWDQATGVLLESEGSGPDGIAAVTTIIADTNLWSGAPGWLTWLIIATVVVCVAVGIGALVLRKKKPPTAPAPQQATTPPPPKT